VVPDYNAAEEAGNLIMNLPSLWASATLSERRKLLITMLDAVYVDAKQS
jgi:site-specific DNA recombinase